MLTNSEVMASNHEGKLIKQAVKNQQSSDGVGNTLSEIAKYIRSKLKDIKIGMEEGKSVVVYMNSNIMVHTERIENGGSFEVKGIVRGGNVYIGMNNLNHIFTCRIYKDQKTNAMILSGYRVRVAVAPEGEIVEVNQLKEVSEINPVPIILEGEYYLPIEWVAELFSRQISYVFDKNQYRVVIYPIDTLKDIKDIRAISFFEKSNHTSGGKKQEPVLILKETWEIEFFTKMINNAEVWGGLLDVGPPDYIVEVYYNDKVVSFPLYIGLYNSNEYSGFYIEPTDSHIGHGLQEKEVEKFYNLYREILNK